jgi:2-dehydropantoate 2-reductase
VIGARLHRHGHDVVLIARGSHLEAIQRDGLMLIEPEGSSTQAVPAVGNPEELSFGERDVVILTMKTQDVAAALAELQSVTNRDLPIVCAQNGVESERIASRSFSQVYGMLVWLPATFLEPGRVIAYAAPTAGLLDAGCYPSGTDSRVAQITAALDASGFAAQPQPAIMCWKYNKLLGNLYNAVMALFGPGEEVPGAFRERLREEALACYAAAGIEYISEDEANARRDRAGVQLVAIEGQPRLSGSSWQSLYRGLGSIETDFLNGEIALLGRLHGVPTPCNAALQRLANRVARQRLKPGSISLAELEAELGAFETQTHQPPP